jgi:mandelate racemase
VDWATPILQTPAGIENGCVTASDAPGTGVAWDEAAVKRFLAE